MMRITYAGHTSAATYVQIYHVAACPISSSVQTATRENQTHPVIVTVGLAQIAIVAKKKEDLAAHTVAPVIMRGSQMHPPNVLAKIASGVSVAS
jgi:hypothetical protein